MKRTIKFDLAPKKGDDTITDCRPIRIRISYAGTRIDFRLGYSIENSKWDKDTGRVISGARNKYKQTAGEINQAISNAETAINDIFARFELLEKREPSRSELKRAYDEYSGKRYKRRSECSSFYEPYDRFISSQALQNSWSKSNKNRFKSLKNHLLGYDRYLSFETLTTETLQGFINYLLKKGLRNTTIQKLLAYLREYLRWASNNNLYNGALHNTFRPRLKGTDGHHKQIIFLTWEELQGLYNFRIPKNRQALERIKDMFCFMCFTSLRYSDVFNLTWADIKENGIYVVTQKTTEAIIIELNKYSEAILKKYRELPPLPGNKVFPVISNQKMNDGIKELGKLANIDAPHKIVYYKGNKRYSEIFPKYAVLSTHCGRRTFVVNALFLGIAPEVIMEWTGHYDYNSMKPYIKIVNELRASSMQKFNEK